MDTKTMRDTLTEKISAGMAKARGQYFQKGTALLTPAGVISQAVDELEMRCGIIRISFVDPDEMDYKKREQQRVVAAHNVFYEHASILSLNDATYIAALGRRDGCDYAASVLFADSIRGPHPEEADCYRSLITESNFSKCWIFSTHNYFTYPTENPQAADFFRSVNRELEVLAASPAEMQAARQATQRPYSKGMRLYKPEAVDALASACIKFLDHNN